jgi:hypothetical protein
MAWTLAEPVGKPARVGKCDFEHFAEIGRILRVAAIEDIRQIAK